jgi:hypothetical protein
MADFVRKRAGKPDRPSRKATHEPVTIANYKHQEVCRAITETVVEAGKYNECFDVDDERSLTKKQYLRILPERREKEYSYGRVLVKNGKPVDESNQIVVKERTVWRSDKTLLNRGIPFQMPSDLKRETSRGKGIKHDQDTKFRGRDKTNEMDY